MKKNDVIELLESFVVMINFHRECLLVEHDPTFYEIRMPHYFEIYISLKEDNYDAFFKTLNVNGMNNMTGIKGALEDNSEFKLSDKKVLSFAVNELQFNDIKKLLNLTIKHIK